MSWLGEFEEPYLFRFVLGIALVAFAVGGFVVWCLMHYGGAR